MKRYERYKPSKVEWIGEIPEHWEVKKLKFIANTFTGKTPTTAKEDYFTNGEINWFTPSDLNDSFTLDNSVRKVIKKALSDNEICIYEADSILIIGIGATIGKTGYLINSSSCNQQLHVITFKDEIIPKFGFYAVYLIGKEIKKFANIVTLAIFNQTDLKNLEISYPYIDEQKLIANYLDKKTAEIEELIADKMDLISLLEQEKELTISNAVTKGLNPNVPMKDSKVKWIGEIPEQWSLRKISHSFNTIGSGTTPLTSNSAYYTNGTIPWINTGDLNNDYLLDVNKTVSTFAVEDNSALKIYPKYSLVIAMYGATIGKIGITTFDACVNQACCVLAGSDYFTLRYIYYWFIANKKYIIDLGYGGGQPNISQEIIKSLRIPCPLIEEQEQIVEYLDKKIAATNEAVQIIKDEIELLKEYKETLIYEVITGKIDVRGCNETH